MPDQEVTHIVRLVSCGKCGKVAYDCKGYEASLRIDSKPDGRLSIEMPGKFSVGYVPKGGDWWTVLCEECEKETGGTWLQKALGAAVAEMVKRTGTCPADMPVGSQSWAGCPAHKDPDGCHNQLSECWTAYFMEKGKERNDGPKTADHAGGLSSER